MTDIGKKVRAFQERIAREYGYKPLPKDKSQLAQDWYRKHMPTLPNGPVVLSDGTELAQRYSRIVVGDYGAFVECLPNLVNKEILVCKKGQEFRLKDTFFGKYQWLTTKSQIPKVYLQVRGVAYADYRPGRYYVCVYEVRESTRP